MIYIAARGQFSSWAESVHFHRTVVHESVGGLNDDKKESLFWELCTAVHAWIRTGSDWSRFGRTGSIRSWLWSSPRSGERPTPTWRTHLNTYKLILRNEISKYFWRFEHLCLCTSVRFFIRWFQNQAFQMPSYQCELNLLGLLKVVKHTLHCYSCLSLTLAFWSIEDHWDSFVTCCSMWFAVCNRSCITLFPPQSVFVNSAFLQLSFGCWYCTR